VRLAFIGGGTMGEAILSAILEKGLSEPRDVSISEPIEDRRKYLADKYKIKVTPDSKSAVSDKEVVVLSIKPQTLPVVMPELSGQFKSSQLILSIIAGATVKTLHNGFNHDKIVRVMPNTPAQIGEGMSVWTATLKVTDTQRKSAKNILGAIGREIYVDDEQYLDMATAISGSGPAYFFLFVEALVDAGVEIGLSRDMSQLMVLQTMLGAGHLIEKAGKTPEELRQMVTSKGGTTAAALEQFKIGDFNGLVLKAVRAAYARAKELGGTS
jgi:pyrroline-5-carboxylate reductase